MLQILKLGRFLDELASLEPTLVRGSVIVSNSGQ